MQSTLPEVPPEQLSQAEQEQADQIATTVVRLLAGYQEELSSLPKPAQKHLEFVQAWLNSNFLTPAKVDQLVAVLAEQQPPPDSDTDTDNRLQEEDREGVLALAKLCEAIATEPSADNSPGCVGIIVQLPRILPQRLTPTAPPPNPTAMEEQQPRYSPAILAAVKEVLVTQALWNQLDQDS